MPAVRRGAPQFDEAHHGPVSEIVPQWVDHVLQTGAQLLC